MAYLCTQIFLARLRTLYSVIMGNLLNIRIQPAIMENFDVNCNNWFVILWVFPDATK